MFALRVKVEEDGAIVIKGLPVKPGDYFQVTIKPAKKQYDPDNPHPLRGMVNKENFHYYLPFEPADLENWEGVLEKVPWEEREVRLETVASGGIRNCLNIPSPLTEEG